MIKSNTGSQRIQRAENKERERETESRKICLLGVEILAKDN